MDFNAEVSPELRRHLFFIGVSFAIVFAFIGIHNLVTPEEPKKVGYVEVDTQCLGFDVGPCIGFEKQSHTTYNYENYTEAEPGTENFYRRVEAELMIRAYNTCDSSMSGMEWTSEVSYLNRTAEEWSETGNVTLLPCESTFYRELEE